MLDLSRSWELSCVWLILVAVLLEIKYLIPLTMATLETNNVFPTFRDKSRDIILRFWLNFGLGTYTRKYSFNIVGMEAPPNSN